MLTLTRPSALRSHLSAGAGFLTALALLLLSSMLAGAQPSLVLRFPFQDNSTGTTTPSDTSLGTEVNVALRMLDKNSAATNLHGLAGSGVAGLTMGSRSLNLSSNTTQGASGYYTALTNSALGLGNVSSFAVSWWMKQTVAPGGNILGRMFFLGNNTNAADVGIANSIGMKWQDASHLYFYVNANQATGTLPNTANFPTNSWIFVAMVYDGTKVTLYEGDENTPASLLSTTALAGQVVGLNPAYGCLTIGDRPQKGRAFPGFIEDFRFYTGTGADAAFVESVRQAAAGPAGLVAVPNDGQVSLSWTALSGTASYNVKRATTSGGPYTTISTASAVTTPAFTDTGLTDGTTYYYTVSAVNGSGVESANSAIEASATPSVPPAAPTGLAATPGNSQIALAWDATSGAASYNVKRSTTSGAEVTITNVSTPSFTDTAVVNGLTYYYVVSAINATRAESLNSTEISTAPMGPPAAPTGLSSFAAGIGQVGLSWSPTLLATSYNVYRATSSGGTYTKISTDGTVTSPAFTDTGASGSAPYFYKVSAVNAQGEGPLSGAMMATPLAARLRFDFSDTGTSTVDSVNGVSLNVVNSNNVATDYHGAANSGVAGAGKALDFTVNGSQSPTGGGPLAATVMNQGLNSSLFGAISNFTVSFWVQPDSDFFSSPDIVTINNPRLLALAPANFVDYPAAVPSTQTGLYLKVNSFDSVPQSGQLKVFLGTGASSPEYVTPTGSFVSAPGLWTFVAVTYDGSALKVYSATQTNAANTTNGLILIAATANQALNFTTNGNLLLGNRGDLKKSIDAKVADFRFYSGAADSNCVENIRLLAANPPASLVAAGGDNQVSLNWGGYGAATSFNIKRATTSGGPYAVLATGVTGTSYTDSTALDNNTYYYVVSAATPYGESANSAEATATASCTPPPIAGNNGPLCEGATLNLTASTVEGASYAWTGPNGFTASEQNPSIASVVAAASGVYSVTVTVGGCTSAPASTTLLVNATPAIPTAGNNGPLCAGATLNLTASTVPGATYMWTGPNGFTSTAQNPSIANATPDATGVYSVYAMIKGCASAAGSTMASVGAIPSAPVAGNNGPLTEGATLNLTASTVPGATYAWTGPNGFTSSQQNPSIANATTNASGVYSVTATVGVCTSPAGTTTAVVNALLPTVNLTIQAAGGNITLGWSQGTLQSATNLLGPWLDVTNATPPSYQTTPTEPQQFFRVKVQ